MFETKQESKYDKIIFISADEDIRLKRLMLRNGYTEQYAKTRIASQLKEAEKIKNGQALVTNEYCDGEFVCLKKNNILCAIAQKDDSKNLLITKKVFI